MVLAHSLRDNGTRKQLAILVTLDSLSASTLEELRVGLHATPVQTGMLKLVCRLYTTTSYLLTASQTDPRKTCTS